MVLVNLHIFREEHWILIYKRWMAWNVFKELLDWIQNLTSMTHSWNKKIDNRTRQDWIQWPSQEDSHILRRRLGYSEKISSSETEMTRSTFLTFHIWLQKSEKNSKSQQKKSEQRKRWAMKNEQSSSKNMQSRSDTGEDFQHDELKSVDHISQLKHSIMDSKNGSKKVHNNFSFIWH